MLEIRNSQTAKQPDSEGAEGAEGAEVAQKTQKRKMLFSSQCHFNSFQVQMVLNMGSVFSASSA
jgi:hypothetical protein